MFSLQNKLFITSQNCAVNMATKKFSTTLKLILEIIILQTTHKIVNIVSNTSHALGKTDKGQLLIIQPFKIPLKCLWNKD